MFCDIRFFKKLIDHEYTVSNTSFCFLFRKRMCSLSSSSDTTGGISPVLITVFFNKEGSPSHNEPTQFKTFCSISSFPWLKSQLLLTSVCKFNNALLTGALYGFDFYLFKLMISKTPDCFNLAK